MEIGALSDIIETAVIYWARLLFRNSSGEKVEEYMFAQLLSGLDV